MAEFILDKQLKEDSIFIKKLKFSNLHLVNDKNYPWFLLIPNKNNLSEIFELDRDEQHILISEITIISNIVKNHYKADKINIATLGNIVRQLHIHIIARYYDDIAWPHPVWGKFKAKKYHDLEIDNIKKIFNKI
jgi:diadenosine tetraphosphate (Ap4A) HIT family hydrolase